MLRVSQFISRSKIIPCSLSNNFINLPKCNSFCQHVPCDEAKKLDCSSLDANMSGKIQVAIIGGGTSPIYASTILKQYPLIKCIHLIDTQNTLNDAVRDVAFIDTKTKVKHYKYEQLGNDETLKDTFCDMDIVAIMDEKEFHLGYLKPQEQFLVSSTYVTQTAKSLAILCPKALVAVFARPVTATMPLVFETFNNYGRWEPTKIIGSVALETMRIESATAEFLGLNATCTSVPVIGGADAYSAVPIFSAATPFNHFTHYQEEFLLNHFRSSDKDSCENVSNAAVLTNAVAVAKFVYILATGLQGSDRATTNAFVKTNLFPICHYFTNKVCFGRNGLEKVFNLPKATQKELNILADSIYLVNECQQLAIDTARKQFLTDLDSEIINGES